MGDFCIFKLELSSQNDNPDIPSTPNNRNTESIFELLPLKYEQYNVKNSKVKPVKLIMSTSPDMSSPILLKIHTYFSKK